MFLLERVISVVAPHTCMICGVEGRLICNTCVFDAFLPLPSRCYNCKRMTNDSRVCPKCRAHTSLKHVWIHTDYEGVAKDLIANFKYERAQAAASVIADTLDKAMPYLPEDTVIIPVPTATVRARQRGYDQAVLLANQLGRRRELRSYRAVTRVSQSRQVGASRKQRINQLKNAFLVTKPWLIEGADVLIVDDVVTTGATIESVARVLKEAGAKSVNAVAFAQKM